jgi:predicted ATP-grasp superfamily ATP-dependent carboligase
MRILITDSDNRSALAATRSLGRQGHQILVAGEKFPSLAAASKYCKQFIPYPSPGKDPEAFLNTIIAACRDCRIDVVLPMTEVSTLLLTERRNSLPEWTILPFASSASIADASNKADVLRMAAELGVPVPMTTRLEHSDRIRDMAASQVFPLVIKPARSRVRTEHGYVSTSVSYAFSAADLIAQIEGMPPETFPILLQERIDGPGVGIFACYDEGRPIAWFAHKRIREKPPSGGVSVLRESSPLDPQAAAHAERLLTALKWHGVAMVEFKRDSRDGSLRLMEINARFWGSLQLAIDAGVDFPRILVELAQGKHPPPSQNYKIGVRSRWFWGDLDSLLQILLRSRSTLNLPKSHPGRLRTAWEFIKFWDRNTREEIFRTEDPAPFWLETKRWLSGIL